MRNAPHAQTTLTTTLVAAALTAVASQPGCADDSSGQIEADLWGSGVLTETAHPRWAGATVTIADVVTIADMSKTLIDTFCITTTFQGDPGVWTFEGVNSGIGTVRR